MIMLYDAEKEFQLHVKETMIICPSLIPFTFLLKIVSHPQPSVT